jgi:hypothetical protein
VEIIKNIKVILIITLFVFVGTISCDNVGYNRGKQDNKPMLAGVGCLTTSPIAMKATTFDMNNQIISVNRQMIMNMSAQNTQPNMTSMYEMYAGVQLEVDLTGFNIVAFIQEYLKNPSNAMNLMMAYVKQNPLLTQFWALNEMVSSVNPGADGAWLTNDDTIDPIYGYFTTSHEGDRHVQIKYSDFGVTPSSRVDFIVEDNKKIKTYTYEAGTDGKFNTDDDVLVRTTVYQYNSMGKMERAINYTDDENTFENVYIFTYDENGRLLSMYSYEDEAGTNRLAWGSYSELTWGESEGKKTLTIDLGLRPNVFGEFDIKAIKFRYVFNDDGTIHKLIQYKPMSSSIDTCYVYVYSGTGFLSMGKMNDESINYSDDEITRKSRTVNELNIGIQTE